MLRHPPLGWMSWMYYTTAINEQIVRDVADEFVFQRAKSPRTRRSQKMP
jgi:hypothetical protein